MRPQKKEELVRYIRGKLGTTVGDVRCAMCDVQLYTNYYRLSIYRPPFLIKIVVSIALNITRSKTFMIIESWSAKVVYHQEM